MAGKPGRSGGENRKATAVKIIEGNPGHHPLNMAEPKFVALEVSEPPIWLDDIGREHWEYFAPRLAAVRVLSEADAALLASACERWSVYRRAAKTMQRRLVMKQNGRWVVPPQEKIAHEALQDYLGIMREFGIGPASRTRVRAELDEGQVFRPMGKENQTEDALDQIRARRTAAQ